ncbi:MAG: ABC transporter permease subunit [Actinobacteria bacterium]|nr:ABC transporter permease subunit [Actinomycetota bacterium]
MASSLFWGALGFVALGAIWQFASLRATTLPGPFATLSTTRELLANAFAKDGPAGQGIGLQLLESLGRVFKGFAMAAVVGIPFGFLIGTMPRFWKMCNPVIQLLRPVSPLAWFPIWLTILVKADPAAVWVIFITALWPTVINTAAGAASVPEQEHDVARVFRFSRWAEMRHIVVPHALPSVITGLRLSMGVAWMVIVAAEMLSAASGIGFFVWQSYNGPGLSYVLSAILLIGVIGVALDLAFLAVQRKLIPEVRS